jgi:hypothetical protein
VHYVEGEEHKSDKKWFNPLSRNVPQCALLIFLLVLTPGDFTRQWGSSAATWVTWVVVVV